MKELIYRPRRYIWKYALFFDLIKIFGQQVHYSVAQVAKLSRIHSLSPVAILRPAIPQRLSVCCGQTLWRRGRNCFLA